MGFKHLLSFIILSNVKKVNIKHLYFDMDFVLLLPFRVIYLKCNIFAEVFMEKEYPTLYKGFLHGGDYNPEQWIDTKEIWDRDMELMTKANVNEATVGIFSWAMLEPEEGKYDFSFLDEIIDKIYKNGGKVILATPSGARPRWMAEKYPEVLRVDDYLNREHYTGRHNHCYTSPVYREKITAINTKLAERYGKHPAVVAWHISNEYGGMCWCPLCQNEFRKYLRTKYDNDIHKLNHAYWSTFWSHSYTSFDQIEAPSKVTDNCLLGLNIDWRRFCTERCIDFIKAETSPLKKICPNIPVTTNMMFQFYDYDYYKFKDVVDFVSWDSYPQWHSGDDADTAERFCFWHDLFRSLKDKPFFLMESTPSLINWRKFNNLKRPGMDVLSSVQAVAHGSDSVCYFQWRKGRGSVEKFHGAVVDHEGTENTRVFKSVAKTGSILKQIEEVCGTRTESEVAVIFDWENMWAVDEAYGFSKLTKNYYDTCYECHRVFWNHGVNCDIVSRNADLSKYRMVVAPMLYMADEKTIASLESYVKNGGVLVATYMLGMADDTDLCHLGGFPGGALRKVFGIWNEEIDTLYPNEKYKVSCFNKEYPVKDYCEIIHSEGAKVYGEYEDGWFKGSPAVTVNKYGKGDACYIAARDEGPLMNDVIAGYIGELGIKKNLPSDMKGLPYGLTAHTRTDGENEYLFVENYSENEIKDIDLGGKFVNMLDGKTYEKFDIDGFGFGIFKKVK